MLIAHYKLDGDATDSSGNGYNLTASGTNSFVIGKIGNAISLTNAYLHNNLPPFGGVTANREITISCWCYIPSSFTWINGTIIRLSSSSSYGLGIYRHVTNNYITFAARIGNVVSYGVVSTLISRDTWYHFTFVGDGASFKAYVNGALINSASYGYETPTMTLSGNMQIGGDNIYGGSGGGFLTGLIDDVRIYDHALSQKEVKELSRAKVLHYDFDDFQEPTYNWFYKQNPRIDSSYASYVATTSGAWQANHPNAIRVYNDEGSEITGYVNSGVTDWTNTYHAVWEYDYQLRMPVVVQNDVDGNWKAKSWGLGQTMSSMGLSAGMEYTISWLQWTNNISKRLRVGLYGLNSDGSNGFHDGQLYPANTTPYTWERVSATFTVSSAWNFSAGLKCYMYGHYDTRAIIKIADVQMEIKDHTTEFTKAPSRTGVVRDISGYNNDATLALATTPQWISGKTGKGSYYFDGTSVGRQIELTQPLGSLLSNDFTISMWCYFLENGRGILFGDFSKANANNFNIEQYTGNYIRFYWNASPDVTSAVDTITLNTWQMITITRNSTGVYLYVNGIFKQTLYSGAIVDKIGTSLMSIGRDSRTDSTVFKGYIDDVRIYATALDSADILELYQTRAQIDKNGNVFAINFEEDPVSDGLVGWWPFSGDSLDKSGYENDGVVSGATLTTGITGEANTAYSFDGVNDYISAVNTEVALGQTYSIAWWQAPIFVATERHPIGLSDAGNQIYHANFNNRLNWYTSSASCNSSVDDADNVWVHYVLISSATTGRVMYRNGVSVATSATPSQNLTTTSIMLGRRYNAAYYWTGKIQDVRIYNRDLSQDEITLLYNLGLGLV